MNAKNIFLSHIQERYILNPGSTKKTFHIVLDISGSSLSYQPGDCVAIQPTNDPKDVDALMEFFPASKRAYLTEKANLQKIHPLLVQAVGADSIDPEMTPLDLLRQFPKTQVSDPDRLFFPLLPRFYSIASSPLVFPSQIHLVVKLLHYKQNNQNKTGTASGFLCERAEISQTPIPIYIQPSRTFHLPQNTNAPIILVGSGCGIAPFRAFLQQRIAEKATGSHWLFFGERHRKTDFYYADFWEELVKCNQLRLDLAFSRDQAEKIYVQHLLWEKRKDLWKWLCDGAYFYVCGDKQMGKDVEAVLRKIASCEGSHSEESAFQWIKDLRQTKHLLMDIY